MKISTGENGGIELRDVFNPLTLRIDDEKLSIAMRDRGFEFRYGGKDYFAKGSVIKQFPSGRTIKFSAIDEDLMIIKRNVEIAANMDLDIYYDLCMLVGKVLKHRKDVARRWLNTEANDAKQVDALHELFEYDQAQLRELLGLLEIGDMI